MIVWHNLCINLNGCKIIQQTEIFLIQYVWNKLKYSFIGNYSNDNKRKDHRSGP